MDPFRVRLLSISTGITEQELSQLKFVCKQHIPAGNLEKVVRPLDLFDELEKRNLLSDENTAFLAEVFTGISRLDLRDELFGIKAQYRTGDALLPVIQDLLSDHYQNVIGWIQPLAWNETFQIHIEHIYTNLEIVSQVSHGTKCVRQSLDSYHEMFVSRPGCAKPRRILVEGKAGVGKSTFLSKVAYDWAIKNDVIKQYKVVVLIELKQVKEEGFKEAVLRQLFPVDFSVPPDQLFGYLTMHQEEVIFLLDGFDEANSSCLKHLRDILGGKFFRNACVVLTSRPGKAANIQRMMDTRLEIAGFTTENIQNYVYKYFQGDPKTAELLMAEMEMHRVIEDIAKVPLTAMLICALWEETPDTALAALTTMTTLFTELTLLMVKRHLTKSSDERNTIDNILSSLDDIPEDLYRDMLVLGECALNGLLDDKLIFDVQDLEKKFKSKAVFDIGVLSQENSSSRLKPVPKCRFLHKSFQEFYAALWLSNEIKAAGNDLSKLEEVSSAALQSVMTAQDVVLPSFLAGLLGENFEFAFVPLFEELKEMARGNNDIDDFLELCVIALFESRQGHLAAKIGSDLCDQVIKSSGRDVSPYGVRAMTYFMQNNPNVRSFILEHSVLEKQTAAVFASTLSQIPSLKELCLKQNMIGDGGVQAFGENLACHLPLEKFVFSANSSCKGNGRDFALIIQSCPNLCYLDLSYNNIGDDEMKVVFDALQFVPRLKTLRLDGSKLSKTSMMNLAEKLSCVVELTELSLGNNIDIGAEGVKCLSEGLCMTPKLESLSLNAINLEADGTGETSRVVYTSLGQAFARCPRLQTLNLAGNVLHAGRFVGGCVRTAPQLTCLVLSGNMFGIEGLKSLADVLPCMRGLTELVLDRNYVTCTGLIALCEGLKSTANLRMLSLKWNKISDAGVEALAAVLPHICQLQSLHLAYNNITDVGLSALTVSSKSLCNLQCFNFKQNLISEEGISALASALILLPKLTQLLTSSPVTDFPRGAEGGSDAPVDVISPAEKHPGQKDWVPGERVLWSDLYPAEMLHKSHVALTEETFQRLMSAAHAHPSLEEIHLGQMAIPKGTDPQRFPRLRLSGQYTV